MPSIPSTGDRLRLLELEGARHAGADAASSSSAAQLRSWLVIGCSLASLTVTLWHGF